MVQLQGLSGAHGIGYDSRIGVGIVKLCRGECVLCHVASLLAPATGVYTPDSSSQLARALGARKIRERMNEGRRRRRRGL
jgi:hypothetical protein